ncbi:hypothetical protein ACFVUS_30805 [Nocardia sp. NPDC058058]|uniref:hypothetical protein n=1 Tax=Nocardia sp. NPDC058058 TaxID=3346317 RepID=UPI0036DF0691
MAKPQFRQRITAWMNRRPLPIPQVWRVVDGLHHTADGALTMVEKLHFGVRDRLVLPTASGLGVPESTIETFRDRHTRVFGTLYRGLRSAHWYV